jgi:hypothetical protein
VTKGVLDEVEAHLYMCLRYARHDEKREPWRSRVPYVFTAYTLAGESPAGFAAWLERFRGDANPRDDVADYLRDEFGFAVRDLRTEANAAPTRLRVLAHDAWRVVHEQRGREAGDRDPNLTHALIDHDVETYVGVIQRRRDQHRGALGYTSWLLTLDKTAFELHGRLKEEYGRRCPASPVLSPDFMLSYLSVGPGRTRVLSVGSPALPLTADMAPLDMMPKEVLDLAYELREELADLPPRILQRRLRDALDAARWSLGDVRPGGIQAALEALKPDLVKRARAA